MRENLALITLLLLCMLFEIVGTVIVSVYG
jgi:hypothetical protein